MRCPSCGQESPDGFRFCGSCGAALDEQPAPREVRKVVTVVFCDLTGSTELGHTTDPEALRATMRGYYEEMRTILERHGGTVEKFIGDAVMAVFGVPVSHEDDALRAIRAAWEMRAAVPALGLRARIGVNTGEVVAGEGDSLVTGDAVNVAARLEQAAEPGEVLIGTETRRLVRDAVEVEPVDVTAKGKPEPLPSFRLLDVDPDAAAVARRLDTPLVGRREELEQLRQTFDRAVREQRCQLFTLLGTAGVGKSRLVAEFLASVDARALHGRCLDYGEGITYWPVVSILKQLGERANETLALVVDGGILPNEVPWAVRTLLESVASEQPLVVVFDDVQWGEETFFDLVDHVADLSRGAPIMLLCVARPELLDKRPAWGGGKLNATTILLEPLSAEQCATLIAAHGGVTDDVRVRILEAADGNPLFVEEMVALVHESGDVSVPSTVQALLQARIDQLAVDERSVIERGAVEGQVFHRGAVAELSRPTEVDPHLVGLVRKELILPAPAALAGDQAFRFRHLLIRDAAYDALPKQTRAELHEQFADWLMTHGAQLIELDEILGYHLEQAARYEGELGRTSSELAARGGEYLAAAGRRAAARDDLPAALKLLTRAVALQVEGTPAWEAAFLDRLALLTESMDPRADGELERLERSTDSRLQMHGRLARRLLALDAASDESFDAAAALAREANELFEALGDERGLAAAADLEAQLAWVRSNAADTLAAVDRFLLHAARAKRVNFGGRSNITRVGPIVWGPFRPEEMRAAVEAFPPTAHPRMVIESVIAEREGRYDDALELTARIIERLTELGLPWMRALPLQARGNIFRKLGRLDDAAAVYEQAIALHEAHGRDAFLSTTLVSAAGLRYEQGDHEEALRLAAEGERLGGAEDVINFAMAARVRARIAADEGNHEGALLLAREASEYAHRTDFPVEHGETHDTLAYVHRRAGRVAEARDEYEQALAIWERYCWAADAELVRASLAEL